MWVTPGTARDFPTKRYGSMKPTVLLTTAALALFATTASAELPAKGTDAPAIIVDKWYNHIGLDPDLQSLRGKAILLEFWATW